MDTYYVIAPALFLCCLYFAITELIVMDKETSFQKRWLGLSLLVASLLYMVPIRNAHAALSTRKAVLEEMSYYWAYLGHGPTFSAPGDGGPSIMKTAMALGVFQPDPLKPEHRDSPIPCLWATGFHRPEPRGEHIWHWCGSRGTLVLVNRKRNVVNVTLEFHCHSGRPEDISISLDSALFSETVNASPKGTRVSHQLELPPGKATITFSTTADPILAPKDPRELVFGVSRLAVRGGKRV